VAVKFRFPLAEREGYTRKEKFMRRVCVFCGSKVGLNSVYRDAAESLGKLVVERGIGLVYGGGSVGLMGVIADAVLAAGGEVIGVIPEMLATKELLHTGVKDMHRMHSMHARKAKMAELSDAFVAMPGGYGTFEELLEMITWAQLGIHRKPVGLLNVASYYDPLVQFVDHAIAEGFIKPKHRQLIVVSNDPASLLDLIVKHQPPAEPKFMSIRQT
jgi:uncharacterized protein (TIGR00730 family)